MPLKKYRHKSTRDTHAPNEQARLFLVEDKFSAPGTYVLYNIVFRIAEVHANRVCDCAEGRKADVFSCRARADVMLLAPHFRLMGQVSLL